MDYKFYETRVVNFTEEYNCIITTSSNCFFLSSYIFDKKYRQDISLGEDTIFTNNLLLNAPIMGLIKESIYYYGKINDFTSKTQSRKKVLNIIFQIKV